MTGPLAHAPTPACTMLEAEYFRMAEMESRLWWYTSLHADLLRQIVARFGDDKTIRILDAGCGTGGLLRHLRQSGYTNCVGLDISTIAVDFSRRQGFEVAQGSIADPAALACIGNVDVIVSMDVMCSLREESERALFLREAANLLNAGGLLIVQTPAFPSLGGIHDLAVGVNRRYTKRDILPLLQQAGISRYQLRYRLTLLCPLVLLLRALQRLRLKLGGAVTIESDVKMPSPLVNRLFGLIQRWEDRWLSLRPFGSSLQITISRE